MGEPGQRAQQRFLTLWFVSGLRLIPGSLFFMGGGDGTPCGFGVPRPVTLTALGPQVIRDGGVARAVEGSLEPWRRDRHCKGQCPKLEAAVI